jgi:hypothetical protein
MKFDNIFKNNTKFNFKSLGLNNLGTNINKRGIFDKSLTKNFGISNTNLFGGICFKAKPME